MQDGLCPKRSGNAQFSSGTKKKSMESKDFKDAALCIARSLPWAAASGESGTETFRSTTFRLVFSRRSHSPTQSNSSESVKAYQNFSSARADLQIKKKILIPMKTSCWPVCGWVVALCRVSHTCSPFGNRESVIFPMGVRFLSASASASASAGPEENLARQRPSFGSPGASARSRWVEAGGELVGRLS